MIASLLLLIAMSFVTSATQLGVLRFLLGFADGAMMPAVQTLLVRHSRDNVTGRIFGYNQSFMYLGNVAGPLLGAAVSATGYRWVFFATAVVVPAQRAVAAALLSPAKNRAETLARRPPLSRLTQRQRIVPAPLRKQKLRADARAPRIVAADAHMEAVEMQPAAGFVLQQMAVWWRAAAQGCGG